MTSCRRPLCVAALALLGCTAGGTESASVPAWELGAPTLQLGEEDSPQLERVLNNVTSAARLPSGAIALANAGSSEIRYFSPTGSHLRTVGRRGRGPGDFSGSPMYISSSGDDHLLVYDVGTYRLTSLDAEGKVLSSVDLHRADTLNVSWRPRLYPNAYLVADEAPQARPCIDHLITGVAGRPERVSPLLGRVDQLGYLWVTNLQHSADSATTWSIYDLPGTRVATVTLPPEFTIFEITQRDILGLQRDSLGVERLVVRPLSRSTTSSLTCTTAAREVTPADSAVTSNLVAAGHAAVIAQETYYADHGRYSDRADSLKTPKLEGLSFGILSGDNRHWFGLVVDPKTRVTCAVGVGYQPPGWEEARARCSAQPD
jgi:hypothetical protein